MCPYQANTQELLDQDTRTAERMARRAARVAAKEAQEKEKEERMKGLGSRDAEVVLNEYPDSDTDSDCYEVVDGQRAKVRLEPRGRSMVARCCCGGVRGGVHSLIAVLSRLLAPHCRSPTGTRSRCGRWRLSWTRA